MSQRRSQPQSQLNTITTYDTDIGGVPADFNAHAIQNIQQRVNSINQQDQSDYLHNLKANNTNLNLPDSWDSNYYYNNYNLRRSVFNEQNKRTTNSKTMKRWCCGNSIRYLILLLSFLVVCSLVANLLLYNLIIIYSRNPLGPKNATSENPIVLALYRKLFSSAEDAKTTISDYENQTVNTIPNILNLQTDPSDAKNVTIGPIDRSEKNNGSRIYQNVYNNRSSANVVNASVIDLNYSKNLFIGFLERNSVVASPGLAFFLAFIPASILLRRYGAYKVVGASLLLSGFVMVIFPFFIGQVVWYIVGLRFILGILTSPIIAFIVINADNWATINEQLMFISTGYMAFQVGPLLSYFTIAYFGADYNGLLRVFGSHAAVTTLLFVIWIIFHRNSPHKHPIINAIELNHIMTGKSRTNRFLEERYETLIDQLVSASTCFAIFFGLCHFVITPAILAIVPTEYWSFVLFSIIVFLTVWILAFLIIKHVRGTARVPSGDEYTLIYSNMPRDPTAIGQIPSVVLLNSRKLDPAIEPL